MDYLYFKKLAVGRISIFFMPILLLIEELYLSIDLLFLIVINKILKNK